jgi:uncharacterized protein (UPF0332 family)
MNNRTFLDVADRLLAGLTEADWRTAAGRAYDALFLEARAALFRWGLAPPPSDRAHTFVRLRFVYAPDVDLKEVGYELERLSRLRNQADYETASAGAFLTSAPARRAVADARRALGRLDQVEGDPTRLAAAVAGIQAAFP